MNNEQQRQRQDERNRGGTSSDCQFQTMLFEFVFFYYFCSACVCCCCCCYCIVLNRLNNVRFCTILCSVFCQELLSLASIFTLSTRAHTDTHSQSSPLFRLFPICSFPFYCTVSFFRGGGGGCCCCCCSVCWSVTPLTDFRFYCLFVCLSLSSSVFIAKGKEIALSKYCHPCVEILWR